MASSSSASIDFTPQRRAAQADIQAPAANEDEAFRKYFDSWQEFETKSDAELIAAAKVGAPKYLGTSDLSAGTSVSIPSLMPVAGVTLTSDFGMRKHPILGRRRAHKGIDLAGATGTPIYATGDGLVSRASWFSSYGLYVAIEHGGQIQTRYAHMSRLNVAEGQWVKKGEVIGFIGSTGRSTGPHLHYEVRVAGEAVNPIPYMSGGQIAASTDDSVEAGRGGAK